MQLYMQGESVDIWKENIIKDFENKSLVYTIVGEFLTYLEQKIGGGNNRTIKMVKLKKVE